MKNLGDYIYQGKSKTIIAYNGKVEFLYDEGFNNDSRAIDDSKILRSANCDILYDLNKRLAPIIHLITNHSYFALHSIVGVKLENGECFRAVTLETKGTPKAEGYQYNYIIQVYDLTTGLLSKCNAIGFYYLNTPAQVNALGKFRNTGYSFYIEHSDIRIDIHYIYRQGDEFSPYTLDIFAKAYRTDESQISLEELKRSTAHRALTILLSFAAGRRALPCLYYGEVNSITEWRTFIPVDIRDVSITSPGVQPFNSGAWKLNSNTETLAEIGSLIANSDSLDQIEFLVNWYTRISAEKLDEDAIVLIQVALEGVAWWYLVNKRKVILSSNYDNLKTGDWLRLLLSLLNIPTELPKSFTELDKICKEQGLNFTIDGSSDGPLLFINTRNFIVHRSEKNLKRLTRLKQSDTEDVANLGLWYLELITLKIIDFRGNYYSRVDKDFSLSSVP